LVEQMVREDGAIRDAITLVKGTAPPPRCGDDLVDQPGEQCDGLDHVACPGPCAADCTCAPVCGDDRLDQATEACDGHDDAGCPGLCLPDCRCGDPSQIVRLAPAADTYIQAGAQATADHGASDHVDVDLSPADIAYLKFDLSAVTRPVVAAKLKPHCTHASREDLNQLERPELEIELQAPTTTTSTTSTTTTSTTSTAPTSTTSSTTSSSSTVPTTSTSSTSSTAPTTPTSSTSSSTSTVP